MGQDEAKQIVASPRDRVGRSRITLKQPCKTHHMSAHDAKQAHVFTQRRIRIEMSLVAA
jgi:hypothetical protein